METILKEQQDRLSRFENEQKAFRTKDRLLRYEDLEARGIVGNRITLGKWIKRGIFPPGFVLGERTRAWSEAEIDAWLESCRVKPGATS